MFSKVPVPAELIDQLEMQFAPPGHEVFQLTPSAFHDHASFFYNSLGQPRITYDSFWDIYRRILHLFPANQGQREDSDDLMAALDLHFETMARVSNEEVLLLPGMAELRQAGRVVGDIEIAGPSNIPVAEFTDESESDSTSEHSQQQDAGNESDSNVTRAFFSDEE